MNKKRAIWMAAITYIASFIIGIIVATALGIDLSSATEPPAEVWIYSIIFTIALVIIMTNWYFKDKKINKNHKEGFFFGLTLVIVGTLIDLLLIVPYILISESPADIGAYYSNPLFYLTLIILLATTTLFGYFKK